MLKCYYVLYNIQFNNTNAAVIVAHAPLPPETVAVYVPPAYPMPLSSNFTVKFFGCKCACKSLICAYICDTCCNS